MIFAIDGYEANTSQRVGIGRYAYEILKYLSAEVKSEKLKVKSKYQNTRFRVYLPSHPLPDMPEETEWWQYRIVAPKHFWTFMALPCALTLDQPRADVIFSPTHYIPRFIRIPRVMSIMDISYLKFPGMFRLKDLHQLVHWTAFSVRHATRILTISQSSKNAIISAYKVPPEKVVVTYPGLTMQNEKLKMKTGEAIRKKYNLEYNYILSVGTLQPRKNYVRLIEAFSRLLTQLPPAYTDLRLVIVGKKGWLYQEILQAPARFGVEGQVRFLDFVPDSDLPELYKHALCFTLPSLYEGFGLPVLEAMAHRCPVVVSEASSLPEIAGRAGIYVQPEDVASITIGLVTALKERGTLQEKARLGAGIAQTRKFTWEKAARQTLKVLEEVGRS